ncbi:MAG: porin [Pseudomonadota bacterium]
MTLRIFNLASAAIALGSTAAAHADTPLETEFEFESVTVVTPLSEGDAPIDVDSILAEVSLVGTSEKILDNGVRLRARGALRLQRDHRSRPGAIGGFGTDDFAPAGVFSGLSAALPIEDSDIRTRLETAYLQVDGGYGELRVGKDQGVAARFSEGPRSVLSHARLDTPLLDPTGLNTIRTRHDLTGPSPKVSYASPRLIGIRGGISYTPQASADGLDRRPDAGTGGLAPETENAFELALNATRRLRESGVRFDFGLGWSRASVENQTLATLYQDVETWSAGTRIEKDDWTFGLAWLGSDNGLQNGDYSAWSAGLHKESYNTDFSIEIGQSEDDGVALESQSWRVGAARDFTPSTRLAIALLGDQTERFGEKWDSRGVVVEITLSQ